MIILIPQSFSESSSILGVLLRSRPLQQTWGRWSVLRRSTMSQCLPQSNSCWNFANRGLAVAPKTEPAPAYRYCVAVTAQNQLASQFQVKRACHRLSGCPIVPFCSPKTELLQYVRSSSDRLLRRLLYSRFCFGLSFHISERSFFVIFAQSRTTYIYICILSTLSIRHWGQEARQTMSKVPEQLCASPEKVPAYPRNGCITWSKFILLRLFRKDSESPVLANEFCVEGTCPPSNHKRPVGR